MLLKLLGLPLTLPAAGIKFCFQQVLNAAEAELTDDAPVREQLLLLTLKLEEGEITEEEFAREEAILHRRLREIRQYKEQTLREQLAAQRGPSNASPGDAPAGYTAAPRRAHVEVAVEGDVEPSGDTGRRP